MATEREIQELILQVQGREEIERLKAAIEAEEVALRSLITSLGAADAAHIAANQGVRDLGSNLVELTSRLEVLEAKAGTGRAGAAGRAILEFSRAVEDAQYGVAGVINNVPTLAQEISKLAGISTASAAAIAGGFSLAAVAAYELYKNWDTVKGLFSDFEPQTKGAVTALTDLNERIRELQAKKNKVSVDYQEIDAAKQAAKDLQEALQATERLRTGQAEFEARAGRQVREALAEAAGGGAAVTRALVGPQEAQIRQQVQEEARRELAEINRALEEARNAEMMGAQLGSTIGDLEKRRAEVNQRLRDRLAGAAKQADIDIGQILTAAERGTGAEQEQARTELVRRLRAANMGRVAGQVERATPEDVQAIENQREEDRRNKERDAQIKKAQDERDRETDRLNLEGARQERMGFEEAQRQDEKAVREQDRANRAEDRRQAREEDRLQAEVARQVEQSGLGKQAQQYAVQLRLQGATPEQEQEELRRGFAEQLQLNRPDLGIQQLSQAASQLARQASAGVDQRLIGVGQQGLNAQAALLSVGATLNQEVQQLAARQNQLMQMSLDLQRRVMARSLPAVIGRNGGL